ncbi:CpsB/CapC family capsule biosynthesis tyrosine phosphatase [Bacillus sp. FJAT-49736]|uniref:tyrosine-protein phosphatase n=1 Tax=Bacillus sp. FJAT-49736 TaxID=2833582 RepID=UPI001BC8F874|nr:CpsB/CapC family capsule biosynthesis tyrosine phosphatase [Bacillus sp. FJAT-49736]MBS4172939.1 tyrosine protein phosphatase [Bacillus sp. FJAT-49736]
MVWCKKEERIIINMAHHPNKRPLKSSAIREMNGLIDTHNHILPSIDDGPKNLSQSLEMVQDAINSGITHVFATPHHRNGQYVNSKKHILLLVQELNSYLNRENIPLYIHAGQEVRIHLDIFSSIEEDEILTMNDGGKYLLLELPPIDLPRNTQAVVYELLLRGIVPIIVHPERNTFLQHNPEKIFDLVQEGALIQLTAGSITGAFGKKIRIFSEKLLQHQLAHLVASDAHNCTKRGFLLREAYEMITESFGFERTLSLQANAEALLSGKPILTAPPVPIKRGILSFMISR